MRASVPILLAATLIATASAGAAPSSTSQAAAELVAQVGPLFSISLRQPNGDRVDQLAPGTYTITVRDLSEEHNFHLSGPGVDMSTSVFLVETVVWTVTFIDGTYSYICDPHFAVLHGRFTVGAAAPPPPPPPPPPSPPPAATPTLVATSGPGAAVSLKLAGKAVASLRAGAYVIVVRDQSTKQSFRFAGPGVSRKTGERFRGSVRWRVTLRAGVYRYWSSPGGVRRTLRVR